MYAEIGIKKDSMCLSAMDFLRWSVAALHDEQNISLLSAGRGICLLFLSQVQFCLSVKETLDAFTINISSKEICFVLHIKMKLQFAVNRLHLDHTCMLLKYTHKQFWLVQAGLVCITPAGNSVRMKTRTNPQMPIKGAQSWLNGLKSLAELFKFHCL